MIALVMSWVSEGRGEEGGGCTRVLLVIQLLVYMKYSNYLFSLNSSLAGGDPHQKTLLHKKKKKKRFYIAK